MTKSKINAILIASLTFLFVSCSDQTDPTEDQDIHSNFRAIVINEGQYGEGTASITSISHTGEVEHDVFKKANNDRPIGDVAQSLTKINNKYYVTLSNSKKIEVVDANTLETIETMSMDMDVAPMYIQYLGDDSIAVTDAKYKENSLEHSLMILDIKHGTKRPIVRRNVTLQGMLYQMCLTNSKLFVGGDQMYVFDLNKITQEGARPIKNKAGSTLASIPYSKIVEDKNDKLWVLTASTLYSIDPETEKTVNEIDLSSIGIDSWGACLDISPDGKTLYVNAYWKVYTIDVDSPQTPTSPIISIENSNTVYNMSISKENTVFLNEVIYGSTSRARIYEYDPKTSTKINTFEAGIYPRSIHFE